LTERRYGRYLVARVEGDAATLEMIGPLLVNGLTADDATPPALEIVLAADSARPAGNLELAARLAAIPIKTTTRILGREHGADLEVLRALIAVERGHA